LKRVVVVVAIVCAGLAGCEAVPGAGPLAADINGQAGKSISDVHRSNAAVFEIVDVNAETARTVADFSVGMLKRRFGIGGAARNVVIGVGDQLRVTIFEAGADGLFSTQDSKKTDIDVVVQPDGKAAIPYVGQVQFRGRTLEQARQAVLSALANKAVEPDVIISSGGTSSRNVTVSGAVGRPSMVPLGLSGETIMEVIAKAGGPASQPYESYVTLARGSKTGTVLLQSIVENPSENIYVEPKDQLFVTHDPRTFTALGEVWKNGRLPFGSNDVNLLEAIALAGGGSDERIDAKGYFVFRYEEPEIVSDLLSPERFHSLVAKGMRPNKEGRYPIVYRFDMSVADSLIVGQNFPIKNRDVVYASRHPAVDIAKFVRLVSAPLATARTGQILLNQ
jgi:polysaccharide export outer membrane protein